MSLEKKRKLKSQILNQIATKLYYDKIEDDDIEKVKNSKEISEFERTAILLAIYDKKKNVLKAKQLVKQYKSQNQKSEKNKTLNIIMQRIENKKQKIFDYGFYEKLLNWGIDTNLKEKFEQEKKELESKQKEVRKLKKERTFNSDQVQTMSLKKNENQKSQTLNQIATKLYYDKIEDDDIEKIKNSKEISEFERTALLLAIYEKKKNVSKAKQLVKQYKSQNQKSEENKTLNIIMQRIENKKQKIFDYGFYKEILHWKIDENLKEKFEQEKEERRKKVEKLRKEELHLTEPEITSKKADEHMVKETYDTNTGFYQRKKEFTNRIKVKPTINGNAKKSQQPIKENSDKSDEIIYFLNKQRALIYVKLQSNDDIIQRTAIKQWDKMENLIERIKANKKEDKDYLNQLYKKIQKLQGKEIEK